MSMLLLFQSVGVTTQVDTRDKRASVLSLALPSGRVFPNPNALLNSAADHQQMTYSYRFDEAADVPPVAGGEGSVDVQIGNLLITIRVTQVGGF